MPLDPRVKRFLDALAAGNSAERANGERAERRAQLIELMKLGGVGVPAGAPIGRIEEATLPGPAGPLNARIYSPHPESLPSGLRQVCCRAWCIFTAADWSPARLDTHASDRASARAIGARAACIAMDYRLAPEHPFPPRLEDATRSRRHTSARTRRIRHRCHAARDLRRLGGRHARRGGLPARSRDPANRALALQLLICPILDYSRRAARGRFRERVSHRRGHARARPRVLRAPAARIPGPADLTVARRGPSAVCRRPSFTRRSSIPCATRGRIISARLSQSGSGLAYTCHPGMIHFSMGWVRSSHTPARHSSRSVRRFEPR